MHGYIYLFSADDGKYKIGCSKNPFQRIKDFQRLPFNIKLVHFYYTNDMAREEEQMHQCFADFLIVGEWFRLTPEDVKWFCQLLAVIHCEHGTSNHIFNTPSGRCECGGCKNRQEETAEQADDVSTVLEVATDDALPELELKPSIPDSNGSLEV